MNTPNPLVPQGSLQSKGKSTVRIAFFTIAAIHVLFIGGLLMQGCKKPEEKTAEMPSEPPVLPAFTETNTPPPTNELPAPTTNAQSTPAPVAEPTEPPAPMVTPGSEYVVTRGDNFSTIAKKNHTTVKAIEAANPGVSSSKLQIGKKLQLPASSTGDTSAPATSAAMSAPESGGGSTYVVKSGDMLEKIARRNGTTAKAIMRANNLKTTMIRPGQKLKMPVSKTASAASPSASGYVTPLSSSPATSSEPTPTNN